MIPDFKADLVRQYLSHNFPNGKIVQFSDYPGLYDGSALWCNWHLQMKTDAAVTREVAGRIFGGAQSRGVGREEDRQSALAQE